MSTVAEHEREQDALSDKYGQEEANAAEENAVGLLNALRDIIECCDKNVQPEMEDAKAIVDRIEEQARQRVGIL